jgi:hypothetical protein
VIVTTGSRTFCVWLVHGPQSNGQPSSTSFLKTFGDEKLCFVARVRSYQESARRDPDVLRAVLRAALLHPHVVADRDHARPDRLLAGLAQARRGVEQPLRHGRAHRS